MAPRLRPYQFYDVAVSLCSTCLRRVDAKIVFQEGRVWMLKRCAHHGPERVLVSDDIDYYKMSREVFIKEPEQVHHYNTQSHYGCPYDCGICPDHEQHGCNLILEVTDSCNLRCPTCYAESAPERTTHRTLSQIEEMLDLGVRNEGELEILQISGGEPTLHPNFFEILKLAKERPIKHLMLNTNGLRIANEEGFAEKLKEFEPGFEVYLQFDSFKRSALMSLRGADLRKTRERAIERLNDVGISTTLVVTVRRGVNDDELGALIDYAQEQPAVRGVTFQPVQAAGRLEQYGDGYEPERDRLTLSEVRRKILRQSSWFEPEDIIPVPCHADSVAMAYALKRPDGLLPLTGMIEPRLLMDAARNTISYEGESGLHSKMFELFSTSHGAESQADSLTGFLSASKQSPETNLSKEDVFRVLIVQFMDAHSFDLRSIRKTCVHIIHPDAKRVVPFDTYNMLYRDGLEREVLDPLRAELSVGPRPGPMPLVSLKRKADVGA